MASDTKTALLNSAERAARRRGFDGFSYADLASEVGISKASIHHHFASKATLAVALMQRYYCNLEKVCAEIDAQNTSGAERLAALIERYHVALDGGHSLCLCVSFSISTESLSAETIAEMTRFRAMIIHWLAETFACGQRDGSITGVTNPQSEAAAALPLLEGAQLAARVAQDPKRFETALAQLSARLHG